MCEEYTENQNISILHYVDFFKYESKLNIFGFWTVGLKKQKQANIIIYLTIFFE